MKIPMQDTYSNEKNQLQQMIFRTDNKHIIVN